MEKYAQEHGLPCLSRIGSVTSLVDAGMMDAIHSSRESGRRSNMTGASPYIIEKVI